MKSGEINKKIQQLKKVQYSKALNWASYISDAFPLLEEMAEEVSIMKYKGRWIINSKWFDVSDPNAAKAISMAWIKWKQERPTPIKIKWVPSDGHAPAHKVYSIGDNSTKVKKKSRRRPIILLKI